jgi:RNA polymerase sigma factor (sigma-70 family)
VSPGYDDGPGNDADLERYESMRRFYEAHHPRLRGYVSRRVGSGWKVNADDVCQEIWLVFFRKYEAHVANYDNPLKVLFPIAYCRIAEYWEKYSKSQEAPTEGADLRLLAGALSAAHFGTGRGTGEEAACLRLDIGLALAELTPRQREALHLHYLDDLTVGETASLMGISENTVKKLLKTALERLRESTRLDSYQPATRPEGVSE